MKENISNEKQNEQSCKTGVMRCCSNCQLYIHEEVGDSDYGAVYAYEANCSEYLDTDDEEEVISGFDRNIERECCVLDFFKVCEIDKDLSDKLSEEINRTPDDFSKTYKLFNARYNNA